MRVITCIATQHNVWLVIIAVIICAGGSFAIVRLLNRAETTHGLQRAGWHFLASVAAGASIWCTHFVGMLAYEPEVPIAFDPLLTIISALVAVAGALVSFYIVTSRSWRFAAGAGGAMLGLTISAMHYTGMMGYRVQGVIQWDMAYMMASIVIAVVLSALSMHLVMHGNGKHSRFAAAIVLFLAITGLHFTGMAALKITPMLVGLEFSSPQALQAMALAVATIGLIVTGASLASYFIDDSTRAESYRQIRHMAMNDGLTGLPNRTSFHDHLDRELAAARLAGTGLVIVMIDLDRFKEINDLRGHSAGDEVLRVLGRRMGNLQRDGEFIARLGGDEFAAVKTSGGSAELDDFLSRLESALFKPVRLGDNEAGSGASIGVAAFPADADTKEVLLSNADLAMYRAKIDITRAICFYEASMDETIRSRRALAQDLRAALDRNQLDLHFQVQSSVADGGITGYEALLRWNHRERGFISPSEFIPVAEENGLILQLGEWALREACLRAANWPHPYRVAVNLSPIQFTNADLPKRVHEILLETGLPASRLELELTETAIFADKERSLHMVRQIKAIGVAIALDDFGTGYASLDTLRSYPFDKIKLDRSFMGEVEHSPQAKAIVRAVVALGKSLEIPVLAEGIETEGQLDFLRAEGCDEAQGYLLGRPLPVDQIPALRPAGSEPGAAKDGKPRKPLLVA